MKMSKQLMMRGLAMVVVMGAAQTAHATTYYSRPASPSYWHNASAWNTARDGSGSLGVPGINDDAVIQPGHSILVIFTTPAAANTILIESGSVTSGLFVLQDGALTVKTSITADTSGAVDGVFLFDTRFGDGTLIADDGNNSNAATVTLSGVFEQLGAGAYVLTQVDSDANDNDGFHFTSGTMQLSLSDEVEISAPFENDGIMYYGAGGCHVTAPFKNDGELYAAFTFDAEVENTGIIGSGGEFNAVVLNNGEIRASGFGYDIDFFVKPDESSTGLFYVEGDAVMTFDFSGACTFTGGADFEVYVGGELTFNQNTTTNGGIKIGGSTFAPGRVTAAPGITFEATGDF